MKAYQNVGKTENRAKSVSGESDLDGICDGGGDFGSTVV